MVKADAGQVKYDTFLIAVGLVLNGLTVYSGKGQRQRDHGER
ncbi:MAG TPA: hypothetical protein VG455_12045 [Acidimicrobiales bacterium]|nr:hypothetical protein [Acidimicrobiales bacterium]